MRDCRRWETRQRANEVDIASELMVADCDARMVNIG